VAGDVVIVLNLRTLAWSTTDLKSCTHGLKASAVVPTTADLSGTSLSLLIGGHSSSMPYGPVVVTADIRASLPEGGNSSGHCSIVYDFEVSTTPGLAPMTVSSLVAKSAGQAVVAALQVGDYYDGDAPQHLWSATDATNVSSWCALDMEVANAVVLSMAFAPDGQLCVSSSGDGVGCFSLLDGNCAPRLHDKSHLFMEDM
jgi:hypothetical protein